MNLLCMILHGGIKHTSDLDKLLNKCCNYSVHHGLFKPLKNQKPAEKEEKRAEKFVKFGKSLYICSVKTSVLAIR